MQKGVTGTGLLVSVSDRSFFDTFKESAALAKAHRGGERGQLVRQVQRKVVVAAQQHERAAGSA